MQSSFAGWYFDHTLSRSLIHIFYKLSNIDSSLGVQSKWLQGFIRYLFYWIRMRSFLRSFINIEASTSKWIIKLSLCRLSRFLYRSLDDLFRNLLLPKLTSNGRLILVILNVFSGLISHIFKHLLKILQRCSVSGCLYLSHRLVLLV